MPSTLKCPVCGGDLNFNPKGQNWKCEYCDYTGTEADVAKFSAEAKQDPDKAADAGKREVSTDGDVTVTYKCAYCGAEVITTEDTAQTFCIYCQRPVTILSQVTGEFKPALVLPFRMVKDDALKQFKNFLQGKRFLPDAYCGDKNVDKLSGIYVPFWLFDGTMHFDFSGEGDIVSVRREGDFQIRQTDTYAITRKGSIGAENVPVDASSRIPDDIMDSIEPFKYEDLKQFSTPYLSGFLAQRFDVSKEDSFPRAKKRMEGSVDKHIASTLGKYSSVRPSRDEKTVDNVEGVYGLLPIWMLYSTFEGENYIFAMNGQTGKMLGNLPMDSKKVTKYRLMAFLFGGIGSALLGLLLYAMELF